MSRAAITVGSNPTRGVGFLVAKLGDQELAANAESHRSRRLAFPAFPRNNYPPPILSRCSRRGPREIPTPARGRATYRARLPPALSEPPPGRPPTG